MKLAIVVGTVVAALLAFVTVGQSHSNRCAPGVVKAYAAIEEEPQYLVGTIPSKYTSNPGYFSIRYNCNGGSVLIRRLDLGTYTLLFPRVKLQMAVASVVSGEGGYISTYLLNPHEVQVIIRGPRDEHDVALRRDFAFSIVAY